MVRNMTDTRVSRRSTLRLLEAKKESWRDQVVFDVRLSGMTKAVAYAMAQWIPASDAEAFLISGDVFVAGTQRALAEMVGCSLKTVHLAMTSLIDHGHIALVRRPQTRDDTNLYRIITHAQAQTGNPQFSSTKSAFAPALV